MSLRTFKAAIKFWLFDGFCKYQTPEGDSKAVELSSDPHFDIHYKNGEKDTPLSRAADSNRPAVVKELLERGADPNSRGYLDRTPMIFVSMGPSDPFEVIKLLAENKGDIKAISATLTVALKAAA